MFFVSGLSSNGKEVFVNPDQVLYVRSTHFRRGRTALILTHRKRLIVDQDPQTVRQRFEDYLKDVVDADAERAGIGGERAKSGHTYLT
jgi:hypothetical protein